MFYGEFGMFKYMQMLTGKGEIELEVPNYDFSCELSVTNRFDFGAVLDELCSK